ncbi:MAG: M50 family metallopeptidase [Armatimonadetes bacterium]|nr:M50 family metallopeptidase [Armatimonadota bacterium]
MARQGATDSERGAGALSWRVVLGLVASAIATVGIWQTSWGGLALYPFTLLSTWYHEMGHAVAAVGCGQWVKYIVVYANGSGLAHYVGQPSRLDSVIITASGPLGPALVGAVLIAVSRYRGLARVGLGALGLTMVVSAVVWVRGVVGFIGIALAGMALLFVARRGRVGSAAFALQFLGVQACISVFQRLDYLVASSALIGGKQLVPDTLRLAQLTLIPQVVWALLIAAASVLLMAVGLRLAVRRTETASATATP